MDPLSYYSRCKDSQLRREQFTEDIRKVIHTGPAAGNGGAPEGNRSSVRNRSPGLAAGAALALSSSGGFASARNAAQVATAASRAERKQALERARKIECPFDTHAALGANAIDWSRPDRCPQGAAPDAAQARSAAHKSGQHMGKHNRDLQQRIGAGAPFDAPWATDYERGANERAASPCRTRLFAEAQAEAMRNKSRMKGCQDLVAGNYLLGETTTSSKRASSLPPKGPLPSMALLPEAQMHVACGGGCLAALSHDKVAYLNSRVLADANRDRGLARASPLFG